MATDFGMAILGDYRYYKDTLKEGAGGLTGWFSTVSHRSSEWGGGIGC